MKSTRTPPSRPPNTPQKTSKVLPSTSSQLSNTAPNVAPSKVATPKQSALPPRTPTPKNAQRSSRSDPKSVPSISFQSARGSTGRITDPLVPSLENLPPSKGNLLAIFPEYVLKTSACAFRFSMTLLLPPDDDSFPLEVRQLLAVHTDFPPFQDFQTHLIPHLLEKFNVFRSRHLGLREIAKQSSYLRQHIARDLSLFRRLAAPASVTNETGSKSMICSFLSFENQILFFRLS